MNGRIKLLAKQADEYADDSGRGGAEWCDVQLEKFAELIIRECYDTIKKDMDLAHIQLIPIDFDIYANGRLRRIFKEHFGVEK